MEVKKQLNVHIFFQVFYLIQEQKSIVHFSALALNLIKINHLMLKTLHLIR